MLCFNPRPLCRERHEASKYTEFIGFVSIHAPYAGSDVAGYTPGVYANLFQSTPPMQGATELLFFQVGAFQVSIHAPYAGSDGIGGGHCNV